METSKNKRKFHTLEERQSAVRRIESGETAKSVASSIGVDESTVYKWKRSSEVLCKVSGPAKAHKSLRRVCNEDMEKELYKWLMQRRLADSPVTGIEIRRMAVQINTNNGGPAYFEGSSGWLTRFNRRHNIKGVTLSSVDKAAADEFVSKFRAKIDEDGYERDDIYNFDESGVRYKALPTRSYVLETEQTKVQKDRITVGVCANSSGTHKIPLFVVGRSAQPRCFRSKRELDELPIYHRSNKKAWMTSRLWTEYVEEIFIPEVEKWQKSQGRVAKVLLVVDNAASHSNAEDFVLGRFTIRFLPANTTSMTQPMDQGVIVKMKWIYRLQLVDRLLTSELHVVDFYKKITVKDAIVMLISAWDDLSAENLRWAWNKLLPDTSQPGKVLPPTPSPDTASEIVRLMRSRSTNETLDDDEVWGWFDRLEAVEAVTADPDRDGDVSSSDDDDDDGRPTGPKDLHKEAVRGWSAVKAYLEATGTPAHSVQDIERALSERSAKISPLES